MADETTGFGVPSLGVSEAEAQARFEVLQQQMATLWPTISHLTADDQTIVVVPSLSLDLSLPGSQLQAYEERFLFLLLLLRQPKARVIYCTSQPIPATVIDYYLGLLPGVIISHARERLFLVSPQDASSVPLSEKLLARPRIIERMRSLIADPERAHLVPFNTSQLERDLALRLGIPMYGADPKFDHMGTKSGSRQLFSQAGIQYPIGFEDLHDLEAVIDSVLELKRLRPTATGVVVKHNAGVSGLGNATVELGELAGSISRDEIEQQVRAMTFEDTATTFEQYFERFAAGGGIVEEHIRSEELRSPSVQLRVIPGGQVELLSTHDQLLGGPSGESYLGARFPADDGYASQIASEALRVGELLAEAGVLGRFAIDFLAARRGDGWETYAIEVNLRKGGTTHPFLTLQFLTDGRYDAESNRFRTPSGDSKCFMASDHVESARYRAFAAEDVFDIAVRRGLHFDQTLERGVVFHMLAALGESGRMGLTAVGNDPDDAEALYQETLAVLDEEAEAALMSQPL